MLRKPFEPPSLPASSSLAYHSFQPRPQPHWSTTQPRLHLSISFWIRFEYVLWFGLQRRRTMGYEDETTGCIRQRLRNDGNRDLEPWLPTPKHIQKHIKNELWTHKDFLHFDHWSHDGKRRIDGSEALTGEARIWTEGQPSIRRTWTLDIFSRTSRNTREKGQRPRSAFREPFFRTALHLSHL
jgi:hypothetical protein